jgi:phosphotransferase system enzyme I (PtsP)
MFPMIASVAEFDAARRMLDMEVSRICRTGRRPPDPIQVGAMFEVPALAWQLDQLLARVDFVSIGSNDLRQFLFASDRGDPRMADRYDSLAPAMLNLLDFVVRRCDAAGRPVSVCGEMAGQPLEAMALVGLGLRSLSMPPPAVGAVKTMIRSLDLGGLKDYLEEIRRLPVVSLRRNLMAFARDHAVAL